MRKIICFAMAAALAAPVGVRAQNVTATVVGTVVDETGAAVPDTTVRATNLATGISAATQTNERGDFTIPRLAPGKYRITGERETFKTAVVPEVELLVDQTARVDLTLRVGAVTETVEVTAALPVVESETSSVSQVVDTHQMENLPLNGRSFYELAQLAPGVSPQEPNSFVGDRRPMPGGLDAPAFNVSGAREKSNGYLIDGVDAQDPHYLTPSFFASVDAIQQFRLQTNAYSAEFGRLASQVNATTRSGTNELRGTAYEYFRNSALNAANFFDNLNNQGRRQPLRHNQFGFTLGGPVIVPKVFHGRNRTFFFVNYEGTRVNTSSTGQASVPTAAQRGGDFNPVGARSNRPIYDPATTAPRPGGGGNMREPFPENKIPAARITPFARAVLALYPAPAVDAPLGNNYFGRITNTSDNNQGIARVDHRINDSNSIFYRYAIFDGLRTSRSPIEEGGSYTVVRTQNMAFNYVRVFTPTTLNELRLGYNRAIYFILQEGAFVRDWARELGLKNLLTDPIGWGIPRVNLGSAFTAIGNDLNPTTQLSNTYHLVNHLTLMRGKHAVKTGIDFRKINYNDRSETNVRGSFNFNGGFTANPGTANTGVSVADLLLGLPNSASGSSNSLAGNFNGFSYGFFFQDDVKINPRVTLNIGLRYELNLPFTEVQNRLTLFDPYHPGGRLLLAGTSTAYVPGAGIVNGPPTPRTLVPRDSNNWAPRVGLAFRPFNDNRTAVRAAYGVFYDIVELQDLRTFVRNPPFGVTQSLSSDQNASSAAPNVLRIGELFPAAGTAASRPTVYGPKDRYVTPYYQQFNFSAQRALANRLLLELGYIGSKGTRLAQRLNGNQAVLPDPARPTSVQSRMPFPLFGNTIRLTSNDANSTYHAGFIKLERRFASGYSFMGSYTHGKALDAASLIDDQPRDIYNRALDKGRANFDIRHKVVLTGSWELPFGHNRRWLKGGVASAVFGGWQANGIVRLRSGFPFTVRATGGRCNCNAARETAEQVGDPWKDVTRSRERWFNTAAFRDPASGTFGSSGRNILDGPASQSVDLSLFKTQRLTERYSLQIRAESFNLLNHTNFGQPNSSVNAANYGIITRASAPRNLQLVLRLRF